MAASGWFRAVGGAAAGCLAFTRQAHLRAQGDPALAKSLYEFSARTLDGELVEFEAYRGKVCVVVNVASR